MRGSSVRGRRARRQTIIASLLLLAVLGAAGGIGLWKFSRPAGPSAILCPHDGPKAHVALLVDKTDPLSFTQGKAFASLLRTYSAGRRVREGELLSVFVLGEDFRDTAEPLFEKCHPGDGSDKNPLTENPELWRKRYQEQFEKPILELERLLKTEKPAARSPIMEMVQLVGLNFQKHDVRGPKRLVIVSDMLHNTPTYSMYSDPIDLEWLRKRPVFQRLRAKLPGVDVEILLLMNRPDVQNRGLIRFW